MLDEAIKYLQQRKKENPAFTYEILLVDDGSRDHTTDVALEYPIFFVFAQRDASSPRIAAKK